MIVVNTDDNTATAYYYSIGKIPTKLNYKPEYTRAGSANEMQALVTGFFYENVNLYGYFDVQGFAASTANSAFIAFLKRDFGTLDAAARVEATTTGTITINNQTVLCNPGCAICTAVDTCTSCGAGYYLDGVKCIKGKSANCKILSSTVDTCATCF